MTLNLSSQTFKRYARLMFDSIGMALGENKISLVSSRLSPRIQRLGMSSFEEYYERISGSDDGGEFQMAIDLLTTNETYFFREPAHFELLEKEFTRLRSQAPLRIWSAACSFGDEPYSLAMLLSDMQTSGRVSSTWSIVASDISDRVLRSAQEGIYPNDRLRMVSPERLKRYCLRGDGESEGLSMIQPKLRQRVQFGQLNLMHPVDAMGMFDAIFLRNVLIYFDAPTKSAVVDRLLGQLRPGCLFFIGTAEGRVPCQTPIEAVAPGVFRKRILHNT